MSRLLYAVRVRPSFRFWEPPWELYSDNNIILRRYPEVTALFPTHTRAVIFAEQNLPVDANPFAVSDWYLWEPGVLSLSLYDPDWRDWPEPAYQTRFKFEELCEKLIQIALLPPNSSLWRTPLVWEHWWEQTTQGWEVNQREQLRRYLRLPSWRSNPFEAELIEIEWEENLYLHDKHEVLVEELVSLVNVLGAPLPEAITVLSLLQWWDESAAKLPADSREQLWRLLCPYPWEIVEVPLASSNKEPPLPKRP